jgi:hypothetical protein
MAQKRYKQGPWAPKMDDQPVAEFQNADGWQRSNRSVAGPLRLGTMPGVGPRGGAVIGGGGSDMGMDRITPRGFDPVGTSLRREPNQEGSTLVSREIRGRR